jgi:putative Mg2+ transporter-C (MgtC) family protein
VGRGRLYSGAGEIAPPALPIATFPARFPGLRPNAVQGPPPLHVTSRLTVAGGPTIDTVPTDALNPETRAFWLHLGTAVLCGGLIGVERQLRGKAAGIRTSILICLGTAIFVALGASMPAQADPTRVLAQVVSGIGFVGGGVILARKGLVTGVTSAAVIWVLAALGALIGLGYLGATLVLTLATLGILIGVELLESAFRRLRQGATDRELENIEIEQP